MWEKEARAWVQRQLSGVDISILSDDAIREYLSNAHPDGWGGFCYSLEQREHSRAGHFGRIEHPRDLPDTPLRQWNRFAARFNLRKGILDEVMMTRELDTEMVLILKVHETKETGRRVKVLRQGIRIMAWKRADSNDWWHRQDDIESWFDRPGYDDLHLWGRIRDMERVASDEWQLSECYRPGTKSTPMDGAVRRLELSHKDVFGKVAPPAHTSKKE